MHAKPFIFINTNIDADFEHKKFRIRNYDLEAINLRILLGVFYRPFLLCGI
jgi:hypothetical protein